MRLHHVAIQVLDLEVARAFYVDVLGLEVVRTQEHALWLQAGDAIVMLEKSAGSVDDGGWQAAAPGPFCVAFAVDPAGRARLKERLSRAGVVVDHESAFTTYVRDPFGARLGFSHYPHPPEPAQ
ncbi:MAG: VOC family protein [Deltaproteobacteria bacterium]|nr:VOC family protein [Deltaproteobacteria bacterium]